jgi:gliding motility-associated-like protein
MKTLYLGLISCLLTFSSLAQSNDFDSGLVSTQSFIKNEGQFDGRNWNSNGEIEYAMAQNPFYIFFSKSGVTYRFDKIIKNPNRDKKDPNSPKRTNISELVHVKWIGANPNVSIVASEPTDNYYSYAVRDFETGGTSNLNHVKGYQKIVYKNLYDNIDVEYIFHPQGGVKYSVILHPGADPNDIQMAYSSSHTGVGSEFIQHGLEMDGKMHIKTSLGEIIEHEPYTFVESDNSPVTSSYTYQNNVLSFNLGHYDANETVVIDPWVVSPTYSTSTAVWEVETDAVGNVYTIGGETPMELKKYNAAGTLQWTYTTPWDTASVWLGTLATDAGGTSYITSGTTPEIERVDNAGAMVWHNASGGGFLSSTEYWSISFNCDKTKLIVGGTKAAGLFDYYAAIFDIDITNGNVLSDQTFAYTNIGGFGATPVEVRSISSARNAKFIYLTHNEVGAINQNLATCPTIEPTFQVDNQHNLGYKCENYLPETQNGGGLKALVANDNFFYTHSGDEIHQWNLNTGALLNTVALPGGANTTVPLVGGIVVECSGLSVDDCGNVYAGSTNQVVKFDQNLNMLSSSPTSFAVYDVSVNSNGEVVAVGAQSDNSATNRNGRIESLAMTACAQYALVCCDASFCEQDDLCLTDAPVTLTPATPGGTWSGNGVDPTTGVFDPAAAGAGTHTITYTLACGSESHDIVVSGCAALTACLESNGDVTVTSGTGPYTWYEWSAGGSTPITNDVECTACGYTWQGFPINQCLDGITPVTTCSTPAGYVMFATGTTVTPTTYPIYVIDNVGDSLIINAAGDLTACSSTCTPPTLSESITDVTCTGGTDGAIDVTVTGTSTYSYSWSNSATTEDITGVGAGSYTITITDQADATCTATGTYTVADGTSPTVTANATATTICDGDPVTLTGSGTATSYTWDNGVTDGVAFNPTSTVLYTVTGTDAAGCTGTDAVTVTVNTCTTPCVTAVNEGCGSGGYVWEYNLSGGGQIDFTSLSPAGSWSVSYDNGATWTTLTAPTTVNTQGDVWILAVDPDPADVLVTALGDWTYEDCTAGTTNISAGTDCILDGCPGCTTGCVTALTEGCGSGGYVWQYNISAGGQIDVTSLSPAGAWSVSYDNGATWTTLTAPVTINTAGDVWILGVDPDPADMLVMALGDWNYTDCTSGAVNISAGTDCILDGCPCTTCTPPTLSETITDVTCQGGNDGGIDVTVTGTSTYNYSWSNSATTEDITGVMAGSYTITVTDQTDPTCTATGTYTVADGAAPTVTANATATTICDGDPVTLTGSGTATSYTWDNGVTDGVAFNPSTTVLYTVTGTDAAGCTATDQVTVTVNTCTGPTALFNASATTLCVGDCIDFTNASINVPAGALVGWNLPGGTPSTSTQYSPTNVCYNAPGTYWATLVITDATFNVLDSTGVAITVTTCTAPVAGFTASAGPYCSGDCITFTSTSTYTSPATFAWNFGNGQTNVTENPGAPICFNDPGTYDVTLIVTDANGADTTVQSITISDCTPPTAGFTVDANTLCVGECVNITNASSNATSYQWTFNGGTPSTSTSADPGTVCFFGEGTYDISLVVTNAYGTDSTGTTVTINPIPSVETIADTSIISSVSVELEAYGANDLDYIWTPSTWLDCPDCQTTTAAPQSNTFYIVTATNDYGCVDTAGVMITVEFIEAIGVPSAFSPNNDGVNDILYVQGSGINDMTFRVYNRYGQMVFESLDQSYGWDGTFQGKPENPGVFVYYVLYTNSVGEELILEGDVTLIR